MNSTKETLTQQIDKLIVTTENLIEEVNKSLKVLDISVNSVRHYMRDANDITTKIESAISDIDDFKLKVLEAKKNIVAVADSAKASVEAVAGAVPLGDSKGFIDYKYIKPIVIPIPNLSLPLRENLYLEEGKADPVLIDISPAHDGSAMIKHPNLYQAKFTRGCEATYMDLGTLKIAQPNEPRFETDENGNPLGILIENSSANLITNSNGIKWELYNDSAIVTEKAGGLTGNDCARGTFPSSNVNSWFKGNNYDIEGIATVSGFLKYISGSPVVRLNFWTGKIDHFISFNMETLEFIDTNEMIENTGAIKCNDGWVRVWASCKGSNGKGEQNFSIRNHFNNESEFLFDGWQIEKTLYPTSLIITNGTSAIRRADRLSISNIPYSKEMTINLTFKLLWVNLEEGNDFDLYNLMDSRSYTSLYTVYFRSDNTNCGYIYNGLTGYGTFESKTSIDNRLVNFTISNGKIYNNGIFVCDIGKNNTEKKFEVMKGNLFKDSCGHIKDFKIWNRSLSEEQIYCLGNQNV